MIRDACYLDNVKGSTHPSFDGLQHSAYTAGYDLDVDSNFHITLRAREYETIMPKVSVETIRRENKYCYGVSIDFPTMRSSPDEFKDHIEHYTFKFYQLGRFITELLEFSFNPSDYE